MNKYIWIKDKDTTIILVSDQQTTSGTVCNRHRQWTVLSGDVSHCWEIHPRWWEDDSRRLCLTLSLITFEIQWSLVLPSSCVSLLSISHNSARHTNTHTHTLSMCLKHCMCWEVFEKEDLHQFSWKKKKLDSLLTSANILHSLSTAYVHTHKPTPYKDQIQHAF